MMQGFPADEYTRYGGLRMHVRNWGGPASDNPRPVVLLHGLASTCRIWISSLPCWLRTSR